MKRLLILLIAALAFTACSEQEGEVFYTALYPIVQLEVEVTLSAANEEAEAAIRSRVETDSPMLTTGSFRLDFNRFDGGVLYITREAGDATLTGSFTKQPAAREMTFTVEEQSYTVTETAYINESGLECLRFSTDLTDYYREVLQDETITSVVRYLYTSHPAY